MPEHPADALTRPPTSASDDSSAGTRAALGLVVISALASLWLGAGEGITLAFPVVAVALSWFFLRRGQDVAYLELVLWLWLVTPGLRRIVDYASVWHLNSPLTLAPSLASLLGLSIALRGRQPVYRDVALAFMSTAIIAIYAFVVGVVHNGAVAASASLVTWVAPLTFGYAALMSAVGASSLRRAVTRVARWSLLLLAAYGVVQWLLLPPWDAFWVRSVADFASSFGQPRRFEVRVFSLSNSPGTFAFALTWLLLVNMVRERYRLALVATVLGYLAFALTQVRGAWLGWLVAVMMLSLRGRVRMLRVVAAAIAVLAILSWFGPAMKVISGRIQETTAARTLDESFQGRLRFQQQEFPRAFRDIGGRGMGSAGTATRLSSSPSAQTFANVDSGYLETLRVFGFLPGLTVLWFVTRACVRTWRNTRDADRADSASASFLLVVPLGMIFGNLLVGTTGAIVWLLLGVLGRPTQEQLQSAPGGANAAR
ncbi:MAG: O-antigen ligase family protein [Actinomycetota bacterium]|nr:O-antigen ligase family protein [Actinomycetota bacterium]